ncbi:hypothetical protein GCM10009654_27700 [Streptomyces hebeiensis]|uniref:DUF397 domain-containing protein n=1 Tax=Streptomyces hebeiensis TaxID=229486 RepID=A0ABN1UUT7_9ACTN
MTTIPDASALAAWRKSSHSDNGGGGCVEVSDGWPSGVPVRDSKVPHGPALVFRATDWAAFVGAVRGGGLSA